MSTALVGSFIHSVAYGKLEVIANGALLHSNGIISALVDLDKSPDALAKADRICRYEGKLIIPGFIDAHCHAPQYVFTGTGMDLGLLEWLNQYTFPTESKFNDEVFARYAYEKSVKRHLKSGTTCAAYFATLHLQASKVLADVIQACGQRSLIGKVNMDRNSPDFYVEPTNTGCMETEEFVRYVLNMTTTGKEFLKNVDSENITEKAFLTNVEPPRFDSRNTLLNKVNVPRVIPAITPRFVPTCR